MNKICVYEPTQSQKHLVEESKLSGLILEGKIYRRNFRGKTFLISTLQLKRLWVSGNVGGGVSHGSYSLLYKAESFFSFSFM